MIYESLYDILAKSIMQILVPVHVFFITTVSSVVIFIGNVIQLNDITN